MQRQEDIQKLWVQYKREKNAEVREKLIIHYTPLVKFVAGRLSMYFGQNVEFDDLMGYGIFGLIDAIDKFSLEKGVKFETYASLRIRGSIIDSIRKIDWVPRSLRQKQKKLEKAVNQIENEYGRPATDKELALELGISDEDFQKLLIQTNISSLISLDEYTDPSGQGTIEIQDTGPNQPEKVLERNETKELLGQEIDKLPEKEKKVIALYYFEDLTLKEISAVLGVSESRISQLHTKALMRLRSKIQDISYLFVL